MTVIPAQVAGVERIVVVSPKPAQETLAAAAMLGVTEFYRMGGAQAIAALAYGTESVARVDKIVGPGNCFVTAAKKLVAFDCAIDMLAGPDGDCRDQRERRRGWDCGRSGGAGGTRSGCAGDICHDGRVPLARAVVAEVKRRVALEPDCRRGDRAQWPGYCAEDSGRGARDYESARSRAPDRR